jgi:hypothetical protein
LGCDDIEDRSATVVPKGHNFHNLRSSTCGVGAHHNLCLKVWTYRLMDNPLQAESAARESGESAASIILAPAKSSSIPCAEGPVERSSNSQFENNKYSFV